jgi:DNA uptake protein ComE-like DNA-binding protein
MKKKWIHSFLYFSKRDRNGIAVLLVLICATIIVPYFIPEKDVTPTINWELQRKIDSVVQYQNNPYQPKNENTSSSPASFSTKLHPFPFDPNTISSEGWLQLGLSSRTVETIINYRNKGGRFYKPEDLRKIYTLKKEEADALIPFIRLPDVASAPPEQRQKFKSAKTYAVVRINSATEEDWKALPGIGDVLSKRIVKFRNAIGGFSSVEEVSKTYGLTDSVFQQIKPYLVLED